MKRAVDRPDFTFSAYSARTSGITVKCPKCGGMATVTADSGQARWKCTACGASEVGDRTVYRFDVHNQCKNCGRYYRVDITDPDRRHFKVLHVACPECGTVQAGQVHKTAERYTLEGEIRQGREPYFGLPLWFQASFEGKGIWAVNREHLDHQIKYLGAGLRERPYGIAGKTQADHLPAFMKTAKNRGKIVKALKALQSNQEGSL